MSDYDEYDEYDDESPWDAGPDGLPYEFTDEYIESRGDPEERDDREW